VYRNGVKLGTADFTATNGTTVVLANACAVGDYVRFEGFLITSFNNAIPNTNGAVGSSLIADGTVTDAKIYQVSASKLTGSRTLPNTVVPAGSVIQVVSNISGLGSTSANAVLISLSITPSSASSRILLLGTFEGERIGGSAGNYIFSYLRKGGSNLRTFMNAAGYQQTTGARNFNSIAYIDLPSTTSSVTYDVFVDHTGAAASGLTWNWYASSLFALEIAA
jgi:hypothetical protein